MKTYRNLYPQVWNFENLYLAWRKARAPFPAFPQIHPAKNALAKIARTGGASNRIWGKGA